MSNRENKDSLLRTKEDICMHMGDNYNDYMGAITPPIFQNSLFIKTHEGNQIDNGGFVYTRIDNPTTRIAEEKIAALEGAEDCLCFSSGMGAISAAIMHFIKKDCHVVLVSTAYGPTRRLLEGILKEKCGVRLTCVRGDDTQGILDAVQSDTALIYLESPSSFVFSIQDLDVISAFAKARGIGTVIDNSYATPLHQNPIAHGIDLVCHTASKYLGGHSDIVAGALAGPKDILATMREEERALFGASMDPHQAWLLIRGIRTLPVRMRQHGESGLEIARFLEGHPKVERVYYPGLDSFAQKGLAKRYLSGYNGLMSFVPKGTPEQIRGMISALRFFQFGVSWGGFESLVTEVSVGQSTEEAAAQDLPANLVRIHVGLESVQTLKDDLEQALAHITI